MVIAKSRVMSSGRWGVATTVLCAAVLPIAAVSADAPLKLGAYSLSRCEMQTPLGPLEFQALSDGGVTGVVLYVWNESTGDPLIESLDGAQASFSATTFSARIPLSTGGEALIDATRTVTATTDFTERFRQYENQVTIWRYGETIYDLTGTLTLPELDEPVAFGPVGCVSVDDAGSEFASQPHAQIQGGRDPVNYGLCETPITSGVNAVLGLEDAADTGQLSMSGYVFVGEDLTSIERWYGAAPASVDSSGAAEFDVFTFDQDYQDTGGGTASFQFEDRARPYRLTLKSGDTALTFFGSVRYGTGVVISPLGEFQLDCRLYDVSSRSVTTPSNGQSSDRSR